MLFFYLFKIKVFFFNQNNEQENDASNTQIKFEKLVVKKIKTEEYSSYESQSANGNIKKFKKFKKIPRASQLKSEIKSPNNSNTSMFKVFKNEPFDVNSQFELFMNSQK